MKDFFNLSILKPKGRILPIIGLFLLFISGIIFAASFFTSYTTGTAKWGAITFNISVSLLIFLSGVILLVFSYRTSLTIDLFDWLRDHDNLLSTLSAPLTSSNLSPHCEKLASLFPDNAGWIFLLRAPGLLIRGEVRRRKYIVVVSDRVDAKWNINLVEGYLKELIEKGINEMDVQQKRFQPASHSPDFAWNSKWLDASLRASSPTPGSFDVSSKNFSRRYSAKPIKKSLNLPLLFFTAHSNAGDISSGIVIALKRRRTDPDPIILHAISTGLDLFVQRVSSILVESIQRREGMGVESLGLVMRVLAHEINNDLQGALNRMDASISTASPQTASLYIKIRALLARANHWSHIMRDSVFLADNMLPVERDVISLNQNLRDTIEEIRSAWPDIVFSVEFPESDSDILVIADNHLRTIIRNLLHNAASFSPEEGIVEVSVYEDGENAHLVVQDEGPGVDPLQIDRIFSPLGSLKGIDELPKSTIEGIYSQFFAEDLGINEVDKDMSKEGRRKVIKVSQGMGVGLTISRAIARAYGGDLRCQTSHEESGGRFVLTLALAIADQVQ